jgi:valyl-tRNA synthetase
MSKSKGNTIDPVVIIDKYGCDALRFTMTSLCTYGGQDIKISDERFEYGRNFANKIWNASRFVLMNLDGVDDKDIDFSKLTIADKWILDKLNNVAKEVNSNIENYRIGETAHILYDFFWNSYCDWYVEIAKVQLQDSDIKLNTQRVLRYVLDMSLRLLHPIMPHITERVWQLIPKKSEFKAIMLADYPTYDEKLSFPKEAKEMELVFETISSLRNVRQSFNIAMSLNFDIEIHAAEDEKPVFEAIESYIKRMAKVENISYTSVDEPMPDKSASAVVSASKIAIPLENLIDFNAEIARQEKKLSKLQNERKSLEGRVNNPKFVANAPTELIEQTKSRIDEILVQEGAISDLISSLSK